MSNSHTPPPGLGGNAAAAETSTVDHMFQAVAEAIQPLKDEIDQLTGQLRIAEQKLALHEDEIKKIVNACVVYENAIRNAEARLAAVERRELNFGMALQALGLAVQGKSMDHRAATVVETAGAFLEFLQKHAPQPVNMAQGQLGNAAAAEGGDENKAQGALLSPAEPTKH